MQAKYTYRENKNNLKNGIKGACSILAFKTSKTWEWNEIHKKTSLTLPLFMFLVIFFYCLIIIPFPCYTQYLVQIKTLRTLNVSWNFNLVPLILLIWIYQTFIIHLEQFSTLSCCLSLQSYYYFVKSHFVKTLESLSLGLYYSVHTRVCSLLNIVLLPRLCLHHSEQGFPCMKTRDSQHCLTRLCST